MVVQGTLDKKDTTSKKGRSVFQGDVDGWTVIAYAPSGEDPDEVEVTVAADE